MKRKALAFLLLGLLGAALLLGSLSLNLPEVPSLEEGRWPQPLTILSRDGRLIAQFGPEKSLYTPFSQIPRPLVLAFLAAEDDRFYDHIGVDWQGLLRAAWVLLKTGEKRQGGSTITMQLARMLFLSPEKSFKRKLKEILLALELERKLTKEQILELYLNRVYLGHGAYGVAAAAKVYYGKGLSELSLAEMATLAGLPKAPSRLDPIAHPERARLRRDYVLRRMAELGWIDKETYQKARQTPVAASPHPLHEVEAPYVAETVREELYKQYGEEIYRRGFRVWTTVDSRLQELANRALREALHRYDERHGYRGPERHFDRLPTAREALLALLDPVEPVGATIPALVLAVGPEGARLLLDSGEEIFLSKGAFSWAGRLQRGDLVRVRRTGEGWRLAQVPEVEGALLAVDSRDGQILALVGGYDFRKSQFNRAVQAERQMGSGFKPFLYTAALESGFTLASIVNDTPIDYYREWAPENFSRKFYGPTRLRVALSHSRNVVSIRLLEAIGPEAVVETASRFGFDPERLPRVPSLALGTAVATPLQMARAYSVFANGGWRIEPYLISRIETSSGELLFEARPKRACEGCPDEAPRAISPRIHYLIHSALREVVRSGTAARAGREIPREDIAGKTGTTNDYRDAWFNGYGGGITAIAWVGFDDNRSLGRGETGSRAALPMWIEFMKGALAGVPEKRFPMPEGIVVARIDPKTGLRVQEGGVEELFREELLPPFLSEAKPPLSERLF